MNFKNLQILKMPVYLFIVFVSVLEKHKIDNYVIIPLSAILTTIFTPFSFLIYILCLIYKFLVNKFLSFTLKDKYAGLMEGLDSVCCNQPNCTLNLFLSIDFPKSVYTLKQDVIILLKRTKREQCHEKLFYSRDSCLGYHYYYRNSLKINEYVFKPETGDVVLEITDHKSLSEKFSSYDSMEFPDDNKALMNVMVFDGTPNKLLVFRFHHCLGDGKALMNLFASVFGDNKTNLNIDKSISLRNSSSSQLVSNKLWRLKEWPFSLHDENFLRGYRLLEDKHLLWFGDDISMNKIRAIKKSKANITHLDVVNACISSSLSDFYQKYSGGEEVPETVVGAVVLSPEIYTFMYGDCNFTMNNRFSCAAFHMPISKKFSSNKVDLLKWRMDRVMKEYEMVKRCVDVQFNYWTVQNLFGTIPYPLVKCLCSRVPVTFSVSSLPGCEKLTMFDGHEIVDFIFMLPNSPGCGLHFIIYTYAGDFRIVLTVDKSVIREYERAQEIIDGFVKYLNELND